ncbi:MAG: response regulator [Rhodospirillaceae bacterium]
MNESGVILAVDDAMDMLLVLKSILQKRGFEVVTACNGREALDIMSVSPSKFETIILDRIMPVMGGLELLRIIKNDERLSGIPVVLLTGSSAHKDVQEGIAAGAYYYVTKPYDADSLVAITNAAVSQYRQVQTIQAAARQTEGCFKLLDRGTFSFRTIDEANLLANGLSGGFPSPSRVVRGLIEFLVNAVEHGNLGITYEEKTSLLVTGCWHTEVERRLTLPQYKDKFVTVHFRRHADSIEVTIRDQGAGFSWEKYLTLDPDRAFDPNGRGIALACAVSFDKVSFLRNGSTVQVQVTI